MPLIHSRSARTKIVVPVPSLLEAIVPPAIDPLGGTRAGSALSGHFRSLRHYMPRCVDVVAFSSRKGRDGDTVPGGRMRVPAVFPCMRPVLDVLVLSKSLPMWRPRALPGPRSNLPGEARVAALNMDPGCRIGDSKQSGRFLCLHGELS